MNAGKRGLIAFSGCTMATFAFILGACVGEPSSDLLSALIGVGSVVLMVSFVVFMASTVVSE